MNRSSFVLVAGVLGAAVLWSPHAHAEPSKLLIAKPHVVLVAGKVWDVYPQGLNEPIDLENELFTGWGDQPGAIASHGNGVSVSYWLHLACPDIDEQITKVKIREYGKSLKTVKDFTDSGLVNMGREMDYLGHFYVSWAKLMAAQKQSGTLWADLEIQYWCSPLVGKSTKSVIILDTPIVVQYEPKTVWSKSKASEYAHACPPSYEVADHTDYGYGQQSGFSAHHYEDCRRVDAELVPPPKEPPPPEEKSAQELALEKYHQSIAQADVALSIFRKAGIETIYDLAHTPLANVTSVLGIAHGKKVQNAAISQLSTASILDPNWRYDRHFLVDPTWFVDPRIRGTQAAQNTIGVAQKRLTALQKVGIVTLHHLANADPTYVGKQAGVDATQASAWVQAAKKKTVYAKSLAWEMAVQRDWVVHPVWLVDAGYLPSADVVQNQPPPVVDTGVTVAATTPKKPGVTPPAYETDPSAKIDAKSGQKVSGTSSVSLTPASRIPGDTRATGANGTRNGPNPVAGKPRQGTKTPKPRGAGSTGIPESGRGSAGQGGGSRDRDTPPVGEGGAGGGGERNERRRRGGNRRRGGRAGTRK